MTNHDDLRLLLQQALPPVGERAPSRDLWPAILTGRSSSSDWSWLDFGAIAAIAILLTLCPGCLWLLLYHL